MVFESSYWPDKACNTSAANIEHIRLAYQACSFKLFAQEEEFVRVQIVTIKSEAVEVDLVESTEAVIDFVAQPQREQDLKVTGCKFRDVRSETTQEPTARLYIIDPLDGWNRLEISEVGMTFLLQKLGVFPQFFKHLSTFGIKDFPRDEGFAGYDLNLKYGLDTSLSSIETCFTWKYVERKKEKETRCPWSIRHGLVYQKHDFMSRMSDNIMIHPSSATFANLQQSLRVDATGRTSFIEQWASIPLICVESGTSSWREFINFLDEEISKISDSLFLVCIEDSNSHNGDLAENDALATMKRLQYLTDQVMRACHMLDLNQTTMERMVKSASRISASHLERRGQSSEIEDRMECVVDEYLFLKKSAKAVCDRALMLSRQLQDTIALQNHETNKKAAEATNQGTAAIAELARKSAHEARVVKILTIVAIIFVPASFAADFMQMGYLSVGRLAPFTVIGTADLWLWAVLAFPLTFVTLFIYVTCEILSRRAARVQLRLHHEIEKGVV